MKYEVQVLRRGQWRVAASTDDEKEARATFEAMGGLSEDRRFVEKAKKKRTKTEAA